MIMFGLPGRVSPVGSSGHEIEDVDGISADFSRSASTRRWIDILDFWLSSPTKINVIRQQATELCGVTGQLARRQPRNSQNGCSMREPKSSSLVRAIRHPQIVNEKPFWLLLQPNSPSPTCRVVGIPRRQVS